MGNTGGSGNTGKPAEETRILLFLAQGFEDLEAVAILDVFGWTGYRDDMPRARVTTAGFHPLVRGRFGLEIRPDLPASDVNPADYHSLVLPGGFHSYGYDEAYDPRIHQFARSIHSAGGYIATMCVGILPIADAGLLVGTKATTYPYSRNRNNFERLKARGAVLVEDAVVIDNRIISCKGPAGSLDVAFLLMQHLMGIETSRKVRHYMVCDDALQGTRQEFP